MRVTEIEKALLVDMLSPAHRVHDIARRLCAEHDLMKTALLGFATIPCDRYAADAEVNSCLHPLVARLQGPCPGCTARRALGLEVKR